MKTLTLCGWSALLHHRTPPVARLLAESLRTPSTDILTKQTMEQCATRLAEAYPRLMARDELEVLATERRRRPKAGRLCTRLRSGTLPEGFVEEGPISSARLEEKGLRVFVTSPAATLLTLASSLGPERLALVVSELMGSFSIYAPDKQEQHILDSLTGGNDTVEGIRGIDGFPAQSIRREVRYGSWQQARSPDGTPTDLWRRPAVITSSELEDFLSKTVGLKGHKTLARAFNLAAENAASPFEVQAAILLGSSRRLGGEGLGAITCNHPVRLSKTARRIAGQSTCYCDLFLTGPSGIDLDIECQSERWHNAGPSKRMSDGRRMTALQVMSVDVLNLTYNVLADEEGLREFARLARTRLGMKESALTDGLRERRQSLRELILAPWPQPGVAVPAESDETTDQRGN